MADLEAIRRVIFTRERARGLRQAAEDGRLRAIALIRHATALCARYKKVEQIAAENFGPFSAATLPVRQSIQARRLEIVQQLKKACPIWEQSDSYRRMIQSCEN